MVTLEGGSYTVPEVVVTVLCTDDGLATLGRGSCTVPEAVVTVLCTDDGLATLGEVAAQYRSL